MQDIYKRSLRRAYKKAWSGNENPMEHLPNVRYEQISSKNYPVTEESICFRYCLWRTIKNHVMITKLPLPLAIRIVPCIITRWNKCKGCIDEMTRSLDGMNFPFNKGTPKQLLIICELKTKVIAAAFAKKHCFPKKQIPTGKGYLAIQSHHWNHSDKLHAFLYDLASNYQPYNATHDINPSKSPQKGTNDDVTNDTKNTNTSRRIQQKQRDANAYIAANLHSRNWYQKFCNDKQLVERRLDRDLYHGTRQIKEYKTKASIPKSVMCTATSGFGSERASQTGFQCATCKVPLCVLPKDGSTYSCHHHFHNLKDTGRLIKKKKNNDDEGESKHDNVQPRKKRKICDV